MCIERGVKNKIMVENFSFKSTSVDFWNRLLKNYKYVLEKYCQIGKKDKLADLDYWFQYSFGSEIRERKQHNLLKRDLQKLMEWKLTRGKFRPRLMQLIAENDEKLITQISEESFKNAKNPKTAIETLCKLRGVGPATASAIMTAYCPERFAFMADESVAMVLPGKIEYKMKHYLLYLKNINQKAEELSKIDSRKKWTPHDVELALWTSKMSQKLKIEINYDECGNNNDNNKVDEKNREYAKESNDKKERDNESKRKRNNNAQSGHSKKKKH